MAKRRRPLTQLDERRLAKRRDLAALLADSLPDSRSEWRRIVAERFGDSAGLFAAAVYPDRTKLETLLSDEVMAIAFRASGVGA